MITNALMTKPDHVLTLSQLVRVPPLTLADVVDVARSAMAGGLIDKPGQRSVRLTILHVDSAIRSAILETHANQSLQLKMEGKYQGQQTLYRIILKINQRKAFNFSMSQQSLRQMEKPGAYNPEL